MKTQIRILAMIMALVLMAGIFAGCGKKADPAPTPEVTEAPVETSAPTPTPEETSVPVSEVGEKDPTEVEDLDEKEIYPDLNGYIIAENDGCKVTIVNVINSNDTISFNLELENKSERNLVFTIRDTYVNRLAYNPFFDEEVAAGKKAKAHLVFDSEILEQIDDMDELAFFLEVLDAEDWTLAPTFSGDIVLNPSGKEQIVFQQFTVPDGATVICDTDNLLFVILDQTVDETFEDLVLPVYIENRTDKPLDIFWENVSVNGYMVDPFWSVNLKGGTSSYDEVVFYIEDLVDSEIDPYDVSEIEFDLEALNLLNWAADPIMDDTFIYEHEGIQEAD